MEKARTIMAWATARMARVVPRCAASQRDRRGESGGWDPQQRPHLRCPDGNCGYAGNATTMPMTDTARFPDALRPCWTNEGTSEGMGPCTFLTGIVVVIKNAIIPDGMVI